MFWCFILLVIVVPMLIMRDARIMLHPFLYAYSALECFDSMTAEKSCLNIFSNILRNWKALGSFPPFFGQKSRNLFDLEIWNRYVLTRFIYPLFQETPFFMAATIDCNSTKWLTRAQQFSHFLALHSILRTSICVAVHAHVHIHNGDVLPRQAKNAKTMRTWTEFFKI